MKITTDLLIEQPAGAAIRTARQSVGLSQTAAAALVGSKLRTWQDWEADTAAMPAAAWALFLLATGQHPSCRVITRKSAATPALSA